MWPFGRKQRSWFYPKVLPLNDERAHEHPVMSSGEAAQPVESADIAPVPLAAALPTWTIDAEGHAVAGGFRELYKDGAETHYKAAGADYRNPHEAAVVKALGEGLATWGLVKTARTRADAAAGVAPLKADSPILDLAAGSGEITLALQAVGFRAITGCDPFTGDAYEARVGKRAEAWSFQDIGNGVLSDDAHFALCVCSYALHLVEPSWMFAVLSELARTCDYLMIISPHKKPEIPAGVPWQLLPPGELRVDRIHVRLLRSLAR